MDKKFLDSHEILQQIIKCRESLDYLFSNGFISSEDKENIKKSIDIFEKRNFCFITKPFKTCDSMGITLYHFMKSLSRNLTIPSNNETEST